MTLTALRIPIPAFLALLFLGACQTVDFGMVPGLGILGASGNTTVVLRGNGGKPGVTAPSQIPGIPHRGTHIGIGGSPRDFGVGSGIQLPTILPPQLYRPRPCGSMQVGGIYSNNC